MSNEQVRTMLDDHAVVRLWPDAGRALNLTRGHTYRAAASGDIEVIRIGRLMRVPSEWLRKQLKLGTSA